MRKPAPSSLNSFTAARHGSEGNFRRNEKVSIGALAGAADAPAKLVEIGEAEAVGAVDEDGVGAGNVQAVFDNGGGHEDVGFIADELQHDPFEIFLAHLAVTDDDAGARDELADEGSERVDGLDAVVNEIDLAVA